MFVKANALADEDPEFVVKARNTFTGQSRHLGDSLHNQGIIKELFEVEFDHYHAGGYILLDSLHLVYGNLFKKYKICGRILESAMQFTISTKSTEMFSLKLKSKLIIR